MTTNILTDTEQAIFDGLPGPPMETVVKATDIWVIEWLPLSDQPTGKLLHGWVQRRRQGWSACFESKNKSEVLSFIKHAIDIAKKSQMCLVLHLEVHGDADKNGLVGLHGNGGWELLEWNELIGSIQRSNLETHCNLVVVVAACIGFAGIMALV